ncbi:MAG TPA: AraC family transcriptional regulator, partial [Spirochaetia bacterium]|nr:AraC family transcriptional regulator [Spirochaetia bacterium]
MDDRLLVVKIAAWLEAHLADARSKDVIEISGYSETRLRQKFYSVTGETPAAYLRKRRLSEAAKEIMAGARIADTALKYGYSSQDNFTTAFRTWFGVTPGELQVMDRAYRGFMERMKEPLNIMQIEKLAQPSLDTTLMGCMKGAADYFDFDWSAPMLFGLSGHAFLINIHPEACPSSPYVWNHQRFYGRMERLGIRRKQELELRKGAAAADIRDVEDRVKAHLNAGSICLLDYLEHQLVSGYDDKGFVFLKPWNGMAPSEVQSLSFGTLGECLDKEGWVHFTLLEKASPATDLQAELPDALSLAAELYA